MINRRPFIRRATARASSKLAFFSEKRYQLPFQKIASLGIWPGRLGVLGFLGSGLGTDDDLLAIGSGNSSAGSVGSAGAGSVSVSSDMLPGSLASDAAVAAGW